MKYFIKKHISTILFSICLSIVLIQIAHGIYENILVKNKSEKVIAYVNTYEYFNIVSPSIENLEKIDDLENILPLTSENTEYKSFFIDLLKENLDLNKLKKVPEKILYFFEIKQKMEI